MATRRHSSSFPLRAFACAASAALLLGACDRTPPAPPEPAPPAATPTKKPGLSEKSRGTYLGATYSAGERGREKLGEANAIRKEQVAEEKAFDTPKPGKTGK